MRCLMWQPANTEHLIYAPQHWLKSDNSQEHLYTEMPTKDWWWETQVQIDTPG
jgi:hypothetical protein